MIIHCLSCGKSISSRGNSCPYCFSEMTGLTLELNGIVEERQQQGIKNRMLNLVLGLVHK